jgi:hypothetical protein
LAASSKLIATQTSSIFSREPSSSLSVFSNRRRPSTHLFDLLGLHLFLGFRLLVLVLVFLFSLSLLQQQLLYVGVDVWGQHFQQGFCMRDSYVAEYSDASQLNI